MECCSSRVGAIREQESRSYRRPRIRWGDMVEFAVEEPFVVPVQPFSGRDLDIGDP